MENFKPVIEELEKRLSEPQSKSVNHALSSLTKLIKALEDKGVSPTAINEQLKKLKDILNSALRARAIHGVYHGIQQKIFKDLKLVTPKYYQNLWMVLGMTVFGMPLGIIIFTTTGNAAFISLGIPIGLPIGMAIGMQLDKKAMDEGKALVYDA